MAEDIFRVEVGVNKELSTGKVKTEIQEMLNDISKQPPEVKVGASKDSKKQIEKDLKKLFENNNSVCGITLGVKGGSNIRGSTGKALTKDILALTSTISQQQVAKITLHLDTQATQKAMLAELKKLKLGVNITPTNGSGGGGNQNQMAEDERARNAAIQKGIRLRAEELSLRRQAEAMDQNSAKWATTNRQANEKEAKYNETRNNYLQTAGAQRLGDTGDSWDKAIREASRIENAYYGVERAASGAADAIKKANDKAAESSRAEITSKAVQLQADIYNTQAKLAGTDSSATNYHTLIDELNRYKTSLAQLKAQANQDFGVSSAEFDKEVAGYEKVTKASENYRDAVKQAQKDAADRKAKVAEQAQAEYQTLVKEAAAIQKKIYNLQTSQSKPGQPDANVQLDQNAIDAQKKALAAKMAQAASQFGVPAAQFKQEVDGFKGVSEAADNYTKALNRNAEAQEKRDNTSKAAQAQLDADVNSLIDKQISKLNEGSSTGLEYKEKFENLRKELVGSGKSAKEAKREISDLGLKAKEAGALAETAGQKFARMLGTKIGYATVALLMGQVTKALRQVYTNVVTLDEGMTELKKVTDETDATYSKFLDNAASRAKSLGSTMSNVVSATASFARLGYSLEEATQLADAAVVYEHVGDEIDSIDDASNSVISTMQAFGIEAKDVMSIVDKFNQIGNRFAISSGGAGEAMQRSAAALKAAGNTIDESLALIASANTIAQNPESVGRLCPAA